MINNFVLSYVFAFSGYFMTDQVQEIKDHNDIVEIIGGYLTLKKAGINYKANCPFHSEKTPSFMINPERQSYKCFGCGEGGDVITFVEKMEGLDFYNALKLLAEKAGITLKSNSIQHGASVHSADKKTRLFEINEWAAKVYNKLLTDHPKAEAARKYLDKRGLSADTIKNFNIGYAPDSWDFMLRFLISKKYTEAEAVEAGVAIRSEKGKIYDRFRGRVMFPISNPMGTTVAFTARILEIPGKDTDPSAGGGAKYLNSSESAIYSKGKIIYGLDRAKMAIKDADLAIMVEGNMDVIACHQAGFKNVVATSGTALTLDQLKILIRYASAIAFCFDTDTAGQTAMKRAVRIALANDITTKIITTAPYKDADEAIKADSNNWSKMVKAAKPSLEYWIGQLVAQSEKLDVDAKKKIAKEILPVIKIIASEIEKEYYIKYLSDVLSVSEQSLIDALSKAKTDAEFSRRNSASEPAKTEQKRLSRPEKILGFVWAEPELAKIISAEIIKFPDKYEPLSGQIKAGKIERDKILSELAADLDGLSMLALKDLDSNDSEIIEIELRYLIGRIKSDEHEQTKSDFAHRISRAETAGDKEMVKKLLKEFSDLIK
ncbi:DNA primase [Candidatus Berkelbacteria bacterium CG10_big_fil_rev_8_21_14_0_10_43_13]|uniref:DNA primase n=1 Tax=Candidatus Berkelbacteria bacterium CG10_big_fil_rev_8_21_14_0_10_43_13 TaxID=1974514 RepID=A0A2H0W5U0_9BACT|nr:MAG: DNA primase [Candidatus Berkelbacteria bacterium CG10_big_fil_rev_8_21_14_0_10_43_13]